MDLLQAAPGSDRGHCPPRGQPCWLEEGVGQLEAVEFGDGILDATPVLSDAYISVAMNLAVKIFSVFHLIDSGQLCKTQHARPNIESIWPRYTPRADSGG